MLKYIQTAFMVPWNLLALFGGMGFSVLSGQPDIFVPLVMAGEIAYLGFLGTHPRFQTYVDVIEATDARQKNSVTADVVLKQIMQQLPGTAISRYEKLRTRCAELRQIALDLKKTGTLDDNVPLDSFQIAGLDRLMWIFLRLLYTQFSLGKFLERTNVDRIQMDVKQVEARIKQLPPNDSSPHAEKMRHTLEDNLRTCNERIENYQKAESTHELVGLELDRLENKIKSLAELGVNRQEPDFISGQVDQVAKSMVETEKTMNDLQFATGLAAVNDEVPELLQRPSMQMGR